MSHRFLTAEEATDHKLALFRLAAQLVSNDGELRSAASVRHTSEFTPPDPYAKAADALKVASTPEQTFEDKWKADRLAALHAEHRRLDAHLIAHPTEMLRTAAGSESYPPPNPYEADIKKLRERDARALAAKENR